MPVRVVVLSHRSLFANGIASRLRDHTDLVEAHTVEAGQPDALERLRALHPAIVVMGAADTSAVEAVRLASLLDTLPEVKVIRLDPGSDDVRVYNCVRHRAQGIGELIEVMRQVSAA